METKTAIHRLDAFFSMKWNDRGFKKSQELQVYLSRKFDSIWYLRPHANQDTLSWLKTSIDATVVRETISLVHQSTLQESQQEEPRKPHTWTARMKKAKSRQSTMQLKLLHKIKDLYPMLLKFFSDCHQSACSSVQLQIKYDRDTSLKISCFVTSVFC